MTIRSRPATPAYRTGWDETFGRDQVRTWTHQPTSDPATCTHASMWFTKHPPQKGCDDCGTVWQYNGKAGK